jgi:chromosome segregation ATPase
MSSADSGEWVSIMAEEDHSWDEAVSAAEKGVDPKVVQTLLDAEVDNQVFNAIASNYKEKREDYERDRAIKAAQAEEALAGTAAAAASPKGKQKVGEQAPELNKPQKQDQLPEKKVNVSDVQVDALFYQPPRGTFSPMLAGSSATSVILDRKLDEVLKELSEIKARLARVEADVTRLRTVEAELKASDKATNDNIVRFNGTLKQVSEAVEVLTSRDEDLVTILHQVAAVSRGDQAVAAVDLEARVEEQTRQAEARVEAVAAKPIVVPHIAPVVSKAGQPSAPGQRRQRWT